jgi:hypothetical protein
MSIETIKDQVRALPSEDRRKLMAFMVVLEDEANSEYRKMLAARLDDRSPDKWISLQECERRLGFSE